MERPYQQYSLAILRRFYLKYNFFVFSFGTAPASVGPVFINLIAALLTHYNNNAFVETCDP